MTTVDDLTIEWERTLARVQHLLRGYRDRNVADIALDETYWDLRIHQRQLLRQLATPARTRVDLSLPDAERVLLYRHAVLTWLDTTRLAKHDALASHTVHAAAHTVRAHARLVRNPTVVRAIEALVARDLTTPERTIANRSSTVVAMCDPAALVSALDERGWETFEATSGSYAVGLAMIQQPDVAVVDATLTDLPILTVVDSIQLFAPRTLIVIITADDNLDHEAQLRGHTPIAPTTTPTDVGVAMNGLLATRRRQRGQ